MDSLIVLNLAAIELQMFKPNARLKLTSKWSKKMTEASMTDNELHQCMVLFGPLPVLTSEDTEQFQEIFNRVIACLAPRDMIDLMSSGTTSMRPGTSIGCGATASWPLSVGTIRVRRIRCNAPRSSRHVGTTA